MAYTRDVGPYYTVNQLNLTVVDHQAARTQATPSTVGHCQIYIIIAGTAKKRPVPASRQAAARTGLARPVRAKRGASAVPPLSRGINAVCPSLVSYCFPSFFYITRPSASTLSAICASLPGRLSPISLPRPCTRRFAGDRRRIDPSPSIPKSSHPLILVPLACPVGPKA